MMSLGTDIEGLGLIVVFSIIIISLNTTMRSSPFYNIEGLTFYFTSIVIA